ncbi:MAG: DUF2218 domain-containing protein [Pseudomonadota bacterium]
MTFTALSQVSTDAPARYIARLCKHFQHKVPVTFDTRSGRIEFAFGLCLLSVTDQGLNLQVRTAEADDLEKLQQVVASHFQRFARQEALTLDWHVEQAT